MITGYEEQVRSIAAQIAGTVIDDHAYGIRWKQAVDGFADAGITFGNPDFVATRNPTVPRGIA
jgi:acetolactate synthase-1/2/3 large subunit